MTAVVFFQFGHDDGTILCFVSFIFHVSLFFRENLLLMLTNCSLIKDIFFTAGRTFCTIEISSHGAVKKAPILLNCQRFLINKIRVPLSNYCNIAVFLNEISLFQMPFSHLFTIVCRGKKW